MYGMINNAIKQFVIENSGENAWDEIRTKAGTPHSFSAMLPFDDSITYKLVGEVAQLMQIEPDSLLKEFGRYWIRYAASSDYGPLLSTFGRDLKECLLNLNAMHDHMGATSFSEITPPRFIVTDKGNNCLEIAYYSRRQGLSPMVEGLLMGLSIHYDQPLRIERIDKPINGQPLHNEAIFSVQLQ